MYVCTYANVYARRMYVRTHVFKHEIPAILLCYRECTVSYMRVFVCAWYSSHYVHMSVCVCVRACVCV